MSPFKKKCPVSCLSNFSYFQRQADTDKLFPNIYRHLLATTLNIAARCFMTKSGRKKNLTYIILGYQFIGHLKPFVSRLFYNPLFYLLTFYPPFLTPPPFHPPPSSPSYPLVSKLLIIFTFFLKKTVDFE